MVTGLHSQAERALTRERFGRWLRVDHLGLRGQRISGSRSSAGRVVQINST